MTAPRRWRSEAHRQAEVDARRYRRGETVEATCGYDACPRPGGRFAYVATSGPVRGYCSPGCRQAAYRLRVAGLRPGERRRSTAPRRRRHRLVLTVDLDVFTALSRAAWELAESTPAVAARALQDAVRAGALADAPSAGPMPCEPAFNLLVNERIQR